MDRSSPRAFARHAALLTHERSARIQNGLLEPAGFAPDRPRGAGAS